jgi:hypothetical protein
MKFPVSFSGGLAAIWLLSCASTVNAHTWIDELRLIASNGTYVGTPGYMRSYISRSGPIDPNDNVYELITVNSTSPMCLATQTVGTQTPGYPALVAAPQDNVALRYEENGHVTLFGTNPGKPAGRGTVFVYGTKQSLNSDTYLGIHRVWNTEGTGGDQRGKLIATRPFDDGRCFQQNNETFSKGRVAEFNYTLPGDNLCQTDILIPADAGTSGIYTLYWVWEWPTLDNSGAISSNQTYTACMDITMTANAVPAAGSFDASQATGDTIRSAAIEIQLSSQFLVNPTALPSLTADNMPVTSGTPSQEIFVPASTPVSGFLPITTGGPAVTTPPIPATGTQTSVISPPVPAQTSTTAVTSTTTIISTTGVSSTLVTPPPSTILVPVTPASTVISTAPVSALTPAAAGGFVTITVTEAKEASTVTQYIASALIIETTIVTMAPPSLSTQATISTSSSAAPLAISSSKVQDAISLASGSYTTPTALPSVTPLSAAPAGKVVSSALTSVGAASTATTSASSYSTTVTVEETVTDEVTIPKRTPAAKALRIKGRRVSHKE